MEPSKLIYNVTVKIENDIEQEWLEWMVQKHIPDVMQTQCFQSYKISKIMEEQDGQGVGYAVQYIAENIGALQKYHQSFAKNLQEEHANRYRNKYVAFRTVLEIIGEG